jgi:hypothetical protein
MMDPVVDEQFNRGGMPNRTLWLPDPDVLRAYDELQPGLVDKLLTAWEVESAHVSLLTLES